MTRFVFLFFTFIFLLSCRPSRQPVNLSRAPVKITYEDYDEVLKRWTRNRKIIWKFDTTLDVYATLLSWEYRWAYSALYAHYYNFSEEDKKKLWIKQVKELDSAVEFVISVASTKKEWIDFEKGRPVFSGTGLVKGSIWKISLKVDKNPEVYPFEVKLVKKITKLHKNMFPYIGHFHKLYVLRFPVKHNGKKVLPDSAKKIILKFRSPLGKADLIWKTTALYADGY